MELHIRFDSETILPTLFLRSFLHTMIDSPTNTCSMPPSRRSTLAHTPTNTNAQTAPSSIPTKKLAEETLGSIRTRPSLAQISERAPANAKMLALLPTVSSKHGYIHLNTEHTCAKKESAALVLYVSLLILFTNYVTQHPHSPP